jgi:hypothetical protein
VSRCQQRLQQWEARWARHPGTSPEDGTRTALPPGLARGAFEIVAPAAASHPDAGPAPGGAPPPLTAQQQAILARTYFSYPAAAAALSCMPPGYGVHVVYAKGGLAGRRLPVVVGPAGGVKVQLPGASGQRYVSSIRQLPAFVVDAREEQRV